MAEILGVIASGVSIGALAGQIASSVVKLKTYLDQVRDAPEDIKILIDEIDNLHLLLSDIEDDQSRNPYSAMLVDNSSALRCLDHCKRGVERLQRVADEMAVNFEDVKPMKKKLISAKIVWKRDKVERYRAELASAVRLLTLACQIYTTALMKLQPDIITLRIAKMMQIESANVASITSLPPSSGEVQSSTTSMRMNRASESSRSWRIQSTWLRWKICSLILGRAWDLEICKSQQGWKFSISAYAVVSDDSLVAKYARDGNIEGLQSLFSLGKASPFSVIVRPEVDIEMTLLEVGANNGSFKLCEFLINQGANPAFSNVTLWSPLFWFTLNGAYIGHNSESCNLANLLGSRSEITDDILFGYRGPVSVFSVLLKYMDTPLGKLPIEKRCHLAIRLTHDSTCSPSLFLMALDCDTISNTAIIYRDRDGKTLLHAAANAIGRLATSGNIDWHTEELERRMLGWKSIVQELVVGGADLHATFSTFQFVHGTLFERSKLYSQVTPLSSMFAGFFSESHLSGYRKLDPGKAMSFYITTLYDSGVNLKEYGVREYLTWEPLECQKGWTGGPGYYYSYFSYYYFGRRRLLGFSYGPTPGDWKVWENEPSDEFVGDFWSMVERKEEVMPGTWIE